MGFREFWVQGFRDFMWKIGFVPAAGFHRKAGGGECDVCWEAMISQEGMGQRRRKPAMFEPVWHAQPCQTHRFSRPRPFAAGDFAEWWISPYILEEDTESDSVARMGPVQLRPGFHL